MLRSELNTAEVYNEIYEAALEAGFEDFCPVFEHGHWWLVDIKNDKTYDVIDAEGPGTYDGFDFKEV